MRDNTGNSEKVLSVATSTGVVEEQRSVATENRTQASPIKKRILIQMRGESSEIHENEPQPKKLATEAAKESVQQNEVASEGISSGKMQELLAKHKELTVLRKKLPEETSVSTPSSQTTTQPTKSLLSTTVETIQLPVIKPKSVEGEQSTARPKQMAVKRASAPVPKPTVEKGLQQKSVQVETKPASMEAKKLSVSTSKLAQEQNDRKFAEALQKEEAKKGLRERYRAGGAKVHSSNIPDGYRYMWEGVVQLQKDQDDCTVDLKQLEALEKQKELSPREKALQELKAKREARLNKVYDREDNGQSNVRY